MLIQYGHDEAAIGGYPLDKLLVYTESAARSKALARHDYVVDVLTAIAGALGGKKSGISEFLDEFRKQAGV
jgi:hypothetical protein